MVTYFQLFGRHGLKMWGTFLLGTLMAQVINMIMAVIFYFVGAAVFLASIGLNLEDLQSGTSPEEMFSGFEPGAFLVVILLLLLWIILQSFVSCFQMAGSYGMASEAVLDGSTSIGTYFQTGFRYFWKFFLQCILILLFSLPLLIPFGLADLGILFSDEVGSTIGLGISWFFWFVFGGGLLMYFFSVMFAPVILTSENMGPWQSLRYSFQFTYRSFGKVFGTGLLNTLILLPFAVIFILLSLLMVPQGEEASLAAIGSTLLFILLTFLLAPLAQAAVLLMTALRYKIHLRKIVVPEAHELETAASETSASFEETPLAEREEPVSRPADPFSPPESVSLDEPSPAGDEQSKPLDSEEKDPRS